MTIEKLIARLKSEGFNTNDIESIVSCIDQEHQDLFDDTNEMYLDELWGFLIALQTIGYISSADALDILDQFSI